MTIEPGIVTQLLLVRHGQTALSRSDAFCGSSEVPLTELGREQAQKVARRLASTHIDVLYSSPQGRAIETATPIADALGLELQTREALREMDFGLWEGRVHAEFAQEFPQEMQAWDSGYWTVNPPDGETQQAVIARMDPAVLELLTTHVGQRILLVGHRTALRLLIGHMLDMSLPVSRGLHLDPTSLSRLRIEGTEVRLTLYNDTSHLTP